MSDFASVEFEQHKYRMIVDNIESLEDAKQFAQTFLDAYFTMRLTYMKEMQGRILKTSD